MGMCRKTEVKGWKFYKSDVCSAWAPIQQPQFFWKMVHGQETSFPHKKTRTMTRKTASMINNRSETQQPPYFDARKNQGYL